MFQKNPLEAVLYLALLAVAILFSLIVHEIAHGYVAYRCGDPTAKMMGRLSFNPAKHLDPIGTACMVLFGFGWAKPVPVNPRNYRHYRRDDILVSLAGITVNLILFLISYTVGYFLLHGSYSASVNMDVLQWVYTFVTMLYSINICLAIFNLLPIPPLDGFHVFNDILFKGRLGRSQQFYQIAQIALLVLCVTGAFGTVLGYLVNGVESGMDWLLNLVSGRG